MMYNNIHSCIKLYGFSTTPKFKILMGFSTSPKFKFLMGYDV